MHSLIQVLILVIVVGGLLYILSILPIDATIKTIGRVVILILAAIYAITMLAPLLNAQPAYRGNPLEDFFNRMDRNNPNPRLSCDTYKRLNRQGEIIWLRMECRAVGDYGRDGR